MTGTSGFIRFGAGAKTPNPGCSERSLNATINGMGDLDAAKMPINTPPHRSESNPVLHA